MAITRLALGGSGAAYSTFADKAESSGAGATAYWNAVPYHVATAPMSYPQVPRRLKFSIVSLREAGAMLRATLSPGTA